MTPSDLRDEMAKELMLALPYLDPSADDFAKAADRILSTLSERGYVVQRWEPIETAPRDGTTIFAYGYRNAGSDFERSDNLITQIKWWKATINSTGFFTETVATPRYYSGFTPLYWMPLPAPPLSAAVGKGE